VRTIIKGIAYHLPAKVLTNTELGAQHPDWKMGLIESKTGVRERHIAAQDETSLDLALAACLKLFGENPGLKDNIDGVLFCTQTPDFRMPGNACLLQEKLKLPMSTLALDLNVACSGYLYGLGAAEGFLSKGRVKNLLLVTAETYSKCINPGDRSAAVLFGDGAAVTWLTASDTAKGIVDLQLGSHGAAHDKVYIPGGGFRQPFRDGMDEVVVDQSGNARSLTDIHMDGPAVFMFVRSVIPREIKALLKKNSLTTDDIDYYVFHQGNLMTLDALTRGLKLDERKVANNLSDKGNTVSASIPIALREAMDAGRLKGGEKVLLCGFGAGISWGTALVQF